jgi:hypothetical protein
MSPAPVAHACNPSYLGGLDGEDQGLRPVEQIVWDIPSPKITRAKMDWRNGSSSRVPALQVWSPEFKHQSQQQQKTPPYTLSVMCGGWEKKVTLWASLPLPQWQWKGSFLVLWSSIRKSCWAYIKKRKKKKEKVADSWAWQFTSVIPATQEAPQFDVGPWQNWETLPEK